jgi:hypothetical protein
LAAQLLVRYFEAGQNTPLAFARAERDKGV